VKNYLVSSIVSVPKLLPLLIDGMVNQAVRCGGIIGIGAFAMNGIIGSTSITFTTIQSNMAMSSICEIGRIPVSVDPIFGSRGIPMPLRVGIGMPTYGNFGSTEFI
jgi:hypothetical protein